MISVGGPSLILCFQVTIGTSANILSITTIASNVAKQYNKLLDALNAIIRSLGAANILLATSVF